MATLLTVKCRVYASAEGAELGPGSDRCPRANVLH